jgi:adenosylhomocysteine nucleosidase
MSTIAIVAALDRELAPLVRGWQSCLFRYEGRNFRAHQRPPLVAVAGGIGRTAATIAARAMVARYRPQMLISAGVAGGLCPDLRVGALFVPKVIIDSQTDREYRSESGSGVLVTTAVIVDSAAKRLLREKFQAWAVDMEAAAVAEVAQQERIGFRCVKAISDGPEFEMPPLNQFVDEKGQFHTAKFVLWAAFRPLRWPALMTLGRNTARAACALCNELARPSRAELEPPSRRTPGTTTQVLDI